jgi:hypothetical protein
MKTKIKPEQLAWEILSPEEQTAVSLAFGHDKSTWEVGEIMGKAHYKYLEIKNRGEFFLRTFTLHYEKYKTLIPPVISVSTHFQEYLFQAINKRRQVKDIVEFVEDNRYRVNQLRENLLDEALNLLKDSEEEAAQDLLHLILDFDRWNNFRVLPKTWQEPSAFKRRDKTRQLKHLKCICNIPLPLIAEIEKRYYSNASHKQLYVPIIQAELDNRSTLLCISKYKKEHITAITKIGLPIFKSKVEAEKLIEITTEYLISDKKSCSQGQVFWPMFRVVIENSINYKGLMSIIPGRNRLTNAFIDLNFVNHRKKERKLRERTRKKQ